MDDSLELQVRKLFPFWYELDSQHRHLLADHIRRTSLGAGVSLRGVENLPGVMFLLSGIVDVSVPIGGDRDITLARLAASDSLLFASEAIMPMAPADLTIRASEDAETLVIQASYFDRVLHENPDIAAYAYRCAGMCLADMMRSYHDALSLRVDQRIASFIIEDANLHGSRDLSITHEQMARHLGSSREVVSRALERLEREGCIEMTRGGVRLVDARSLRNLIR